MPISPNEAQKRSAIVLDARRAQRIHDIEEMIDNALSTGYDYTTIPGTVPADLQEAISKAYVAAGWTITFGPTTKPGRTKIALRAASCPTSA